MAHVVGAGKLLVDDDGIVHVGDGGVHGLRVTIMLAYVDVTLARSSAVDVSILNLAQFNLRNVSSSAEWTGVRGQYAGAGGVHGVPVDLVLDVETGGILEASCVH